MAGEAGGKKFFADFLPTAGEKAVKHGGLQGHYAAKERIGIAILTEIRVFCSNMERKKLTCVSYQNKKAKDFFVPCRPYSDRTAPVHSVEAALYRPARITPGLIMSTCALI